MTVTPVLDLLRAVESGEVPQPSFADGVRNQRVLDAIEARSRQTLPMSLGSRRTWLAAAALLLGTGVVGGVVGNQIGRHNDHRTGMTIAGYTVLDGMGGRLSGDVLGYIVYLFVLDTLPAAGALSGSPLPGDTIPAGITYTPVSGFTGRSGR